MAANGRSWKRLDMNSIRLRVRGAAQYLGVSKSTLDKRRVAGLPPIYSKIGGSIVYDTADLDKFLSESKRHSTSEAGAASPK
jgi:predicted DNA-binding transcriptional regulator AlpA